MKTPNQTPQFILSDGAPAELLQFYTVKALRPKTRLTRGSSSYSR